jgi:hypothetical protein
MWTERPCLGPFEIRGIVMFEVVDVTNLCVRSVHEVISVRDDYILCVPGSGLNRADLGTMISGLIILVKV